VADGRFFLCSLCAQRVRLLKAIRGAASRGLAALTIGDVLGTVNAQPERRRSQLPLS
jgi:hypothetical protein